MSVLAHAEIGFSLRNSGGATTCDRFAFSDEIGVSAGGGNGLGAKRSSFGVQNANFGWGIGPAALRWHSTKERNIASTADRHHGDSIRAKL